LDRELAHVAAGRPVLPALACLEAVSRNMELIISWFEMSANQSAQSVSVTLEQLISTGRFYIHLPSSADQQSALSCVYTSNLAGAATAVELTMSSVALAEFVSKLYLNHHQEANLADFDARIDFFLGCFKVSRHCNCVYAPSVNVGMVRTACNRRA